MPIATWPVCSGFLAPNSSPKVLRYFSSFAKPPSDFTRSCCQVNIAAKPGSLATWDLPAASKYFTPHWAARWVGVDS